MLDAMKLLPIPVPAKSIIAAEFLAAMSVVFRAHDDHAAIMWMFSELINVVESLSWETRQEVAPLFEELILHPKESDDVAAEIVRLIERDQARKRPEPKSSRQVH